MYYVAEYKSIKVPGSSKTKLEEMVNESGVDQQKLAGRVIDWLYEQDVDLRAAIIGSLPRSRTPAFAKMILEAMANERDAAVSSASEAAIQEMDSAGKHTTAQRTRSSNRKPAEGAR